MPCRHFRVYRLVWNLDKRELEARVDGKIDVESEKLRNELQAEVSTLETRLQGVSSASQRRDKSIEASNVLLEQMWLREASLRKAQTTILKEDMKALNERATELEAERGSAAAVVSAARVEVKAAEATQAAEASPAAPDQADGDAEADEAHPRLDALGELVQETMVQLAALTQLPQSGCAKTSAPLSTTSIADDTTEDSSRLESGSETDDEPESQLDNTESGNPESGSETEPEEPDEAEALV